MENELLRHYKKYSNKTVAQAYEIGYPLSNPGNLTLRQQASYVVRNALHSLAWKVPIIRFEGIADSGNSYYFSNWGGTGLMFHKSNFSPKPLYVAVATMTQQLDGAKFSRIIDTGSAALYAFEFKKKNGAFVTSLWTPNAPRDVRLSASSPLTVTDSMGNARVLAGAKNGVTLRATFEPMFVESARPLQLRAAVPLLAEAPPREYSQIAPLDDASQWRVVNGQNDELESYNFMQPRRAGEFAVKTVGASAPRRIERLFAFLAIAVATRPLGGIAGGCDARRSSRPRRATQGVVVAAHDAVYRARRTYANHVWVMMYDDSVKAAAEFKEPTWAFAHGAPLTQPWAVDKPIEHAETAALFQEGLDYFQPQPYTAREYSRDLVAVEFPDQTEAATFVRAQGALQFALHSARGEALVLQVRMRTIYQDKSGAKYIVTDQDGKRVGGGVLPPDAVRHDLKIEVPRAGTYFVRLDDGDSGMEVGLDGKLAAALVLEPGPGGTYLGIGGYFYVPKNTARFDYIALGGRRSVGSSMHLLHRPGGETPQRNTRIRQTISVKVALEEAGKSWRISEMNSPDVIFYNLPNALSLSPRRMLIPREVVEKDGLAIAN